MDQICQKLKKKTGKKPSYFLFASNAPKSHWMVSNDQNLHFGGSKMPKTTTKLPPKLQLFFLVTNAPKRHLVVNLSQIFTIFCILAQNDIVYMSHGFGCHGYHFSVKLCVTIVTKIDICIINWLLRAEYRLYTFV